MINKIKSLGFIFPIMIYYVLEALIVSLFITVIWNSILYDVFGKIIGYFQWVAIYWIIKVLLFDIFKIISSFSAAGTLNNETNKNEQE